MRSVAGRKRLLLTGALCALAGLGSPSAQAGSVRSCSPVLNPYPGTRFHDVDLRRIRARGLSCRSARRVARGAHRSALAGTTSASRRAAPQPYGRRLGSVLWWSRELIGALPGVDAQPSAKRAASVAGRSPAGRR